MNHKVHYNGFINEDVKTIETNAERKMPEYTCKTEISPKTDRVYKVFFTKNEE